MRYYLRNYLAKFTFIIVFCTLFHQNSIYAANQWSCEGLLGGEALGIQLVKSGEIDDYWIPNAELRPIFAAQKLSFPQEFNSLPELLSRSENLKKSIRIFVTSLEPSAPLSEESSSLLLVNRFYQVIFNDGKLRDGAINKISALLNSALLRALNGMSVAEMNLLEPNLRYQAWAKALDLEFLRRWNNSEEVVYSWVQTDGDEAIEAFGSGIISSPIIEIDSGFKSVSDLINTISERRKTRILKRGENYRDSFRFAIESLEKNFFEHIQTEFAELYSLKNSGALDNVHTLLQPFAQPLKHFNEGGQKEASEVIQRILGSKKFFEHFEAFTTYYLGAEELLQKLSHDPRLTPLERKTLSEIATDRMILYTVDLVNAGLDFKNPHEYRYRPYMLQLQGANGRLERSVIPLRNVKDIGLK